VLRRQPLPIFYSLQLIELVPVFEAKFKSFEELQKTIRERHLKDGKTTPSAQAAVENEMRELLEQEIELPGKKIPRAVILNCGGKITADEMEELLWLIEPAEPAK